MGQFETSTQEVDDARRIETADAEVLAKELAETHDCLRAFIGPAGYSTLGYHLGIRFIEPEDLPDDRDYLIAPYIVNGPDVTVRGLALWVLREGGATDGTIQASLKDEA